MSEAKFTKGEWTPCMYNNDDIQVTFFGVVIGGCYHNLGSGIEYQANTHLIAAAPEMYNMISLLLTNSTFNVEHPVFAEELESLLAKARGEL